MMILKSDPEAREAFSSILFRSGYYTLTAYFLVLIFEKLVMFVSAALYGYQIAFDYEYLKVTGDYKDWSQESVLIIYLFPYLIFAVTIVWLHFKNQKYNVKKPEYSQIFLHWVIFFLAYRIIGMLPAHLISNTGIYHAFSWLYMGTTTIAILAVSGTTLFFTLAVWLLHRIYFQIARINDNLEVLRTPLLVVSSIALPSAICCLTAVLFFLPGLPKEEIIGLVFIALPVIFTFTRLSWLKPALHQPRHYLDEIFNQWQLFLAVFVIIAILRIGLIFGITIK